MGQEINYCFKCSSRIVGGDTAVQIGNRTCCTKCAPGVLAKMTEADRDVALAEMNREKPSRKTPRSGTEISSTRTPRIGTPAAPPRRSRLHPLW